MLRYVSTNRRGYAQKPLQTDQIFLHRKVCAQKKSIHTPLQTEVFTQRRKYLHTDASHRDAFVRKRRIGIFTHRTFYTEKPLHRIVFTHVFSTPQTLTKRNFCTQTAHRSFYAGECFSHKPFRTKKNCTTIFTDRRFLHTESSPHRGLTHRRFYGFTRRIVYIQTFLHTDVFTQTQTAHRNLCTQHAFTYNQFLHRQALFPLFDRLPFVSPFSGTYLPASKHTDRQTDRKTDRPTNGQRDRHI